MPPALLRLRLRATVRELAPDAMSVAPDWLHLVRKRIREGAGIKRMSERVVERFHDRA